MKTKDDNVHNSDKSILTHCKDKRLVLTAVFMVAILLVALVVGISRTLNSNQGATIAVRVFNRNSEYTKDNSNNVLYFSYNDKLYESMLQEWIGERVGYKFDHWTIDANTADKDVFSGDGAGVDEGGRYILINDNLTLYGVWKSDVEGKHLVVFDDLDKNNRFFDLLVDDGTAIDQSVLPSWIKQTIDDNDWNWHKDNEVFDFATAILKDTYLVLKDNRKFEVGQGEDIVYYHIAIVKGGEIRRDYLPHGKPLSSILNEDEKTKFSWHTKGDDDKISDAIDIHAEVKSNLTIVGIAKKDDGSKQSLYKISPHVAFGEKSGTAKYFFFDGIVGATDDLNQIDNVIYEFFDSSTSKKVLKVKISENINAFAQKGKMGGSIKIIDTDDAASPDNFAFDTSVGWQDLLDGKVKSVNIKAVVHLIDNSSIEIEKNDIPVVEYVG